MEINYLDIVNENEFLSNNYHVRMCSSQEKGLKWHAKKCLDAHSLDDLRQSTHLLQGSELSRAMCILAALQRQ